MAKIMDEKIIGSRIGATFIDVMIWLLIFILFCIATNNVDTTNGIRFYLEGWPFVIYSSLGVLYGTVMEAAWGGTIGKLIWGITVVNETGDRITYAQSFKRNIMRFVDGFPYVIPYFVGILAVASSPTKQRLGDRVAHTYVVRPEKGQANQQFSKPKRVL